MYEIRSAHAYLLSFLLFFSERPCLLSKWKSFVRFLAAGIKKMLKVYVSCVLSLWTHSQVMPPLESFNLRDEKEKKIYIFGFISKPVNLCIHLKKWEILLLEETGKKVRRHCLVSCHMFSELFVIRRIL